MAIPDDVRKKYVATIGIETHVQLKTKTKLFSAVSNDARDAAPNTLISHIDTGLPGALPVLNRAAIDLAVQAAFALNTEPQPFSKFDRKHYFYPDLPKGYQITQFEDPIIKGGYVEFAISGQTKRVNIVRVHLEEDAGKNTHPEGADYSLVDLNRAGTPLLEIVSEPEMHSPAEAKAYARELYLLMKYAGVSDVDLYHGNMRFDVNVSVSKEEGKLSKRSEVKNLNSFRSVESAVTYEIERQIELNEQGKAVEQETRGWDEAKQKTTSQRGKEEAQDYRYMPEPDIPPVNLSPDSVNEIKSQMPKLPAEIREILNKLSISDNVIEDVLDKYEIVPAITEYYEKLGPKAARLVVFWILQEQIGEMNIEVQRIKQLSEMTDAEQLSSTSAQKVFHEMINSTETPQTIAERLGLLQVSDESEIEQIVAEVIKENEGVAQQIKNGEEKAIGFLVGQVMAKSQGRANPKLVQEFIKKQLSS